MRKIKALYTNELQKIFRRPVYPILMGLVVASIVVSGVLLASLIWFVDSGYTPWEYTEEEYRGMITDNRNEYERSQSAAAGQVESIKKLWKENDLDPSTFWELFENDSYQSILYAFENDFWMLSDNIRSMRYSYEEMRRMELCLQYGLSNPYWSGYKSTCVQYISSYDADAVAEEYRNELRADPVIACLEELFGELGSSYGYYGDYYYGKEPVREEEKDASASERYEMYCRILENGNYAEYIAFENKQIRENPAYTEEEKEIRIQANDLLLEANPSGEENSERVSEIQDGISRWANQKTMAVTGMKNGVKLMESEIEEAEYTANEIMLALQKGAVGYGAGKSEESELYSNLILLIGVSIASIVVILIAATMISDEIQTGSIKSLIIAPVKRGKIFIAKLLTVVTVCLIEIVLIFVTFSLVNSLLGFGSGPIAYTVFGKACVIPYYLYVLADLFIRFIDVFMYASLALMFSALIRNSAVSICLTLLDYLLVSNIVKVVVASIDDSIIRTLAAMFMPSTNLGLTGSFFHQYARVSEYGLNFNLIGAMFGLSELPSIPLWFSLCYLAILAFCLLYTAYDSFCRRDIK